MAVISNRATARGGSQAEDVIKEPKPQRAEAGLRLTASPKVQPVGIRLHRRKQPLSETDASILSLASNA